MAVFIKNVSNQNTNWPVLLKGKHHFIEKASKSDVLQYVNVLEVNPSISYQLVGLGHKNPLVV